MHTATYSIGKLEKSRGRFHIVSLTWPIFHSRVEIKDEKKKCPGGLDITLSVKNPFLTSKNFKAHLNNIYSE